MVMKVMRKISGKWCKVRAILFSTQISDNEFSRSLSYEGGVEGFLRYIRSRKSPVFLLDCKNQGKIIDAVREEHPHAIQATINDADKICQRIFELLGASVLYPAGKIDWHADFKSGYVWNPRTYYKEIKYGDKENVDIKVPYELSRFQHLATLGKAYWYTGDEKYAKEFVDEISDWIDSNPPQYGVNWTCAMEVAIRAVNWLWGFYFFKDSTEITDDFLLKFLKSLLAHGRHIINNLEKSKVTTNHYLSDIVGLVYLGIMFPEFKEARKWREFGIEELGSEMEKQVYEDGVDFEASTGYHRLALELFASSALLCKLNGIQLPDKFWNRLEKMFDFALHYLKPNGMAPQIGDNDNGRLHMLTTRDVLDHSYLLSIGAVLFQDGRFKVKEFGFDEEALWLFGTDGYEKYDRLPDSNVPVSSKAFKDSGIYIMRDGSNYMIISCGPNGQNKKGGHAHNDKLSFELQVNGKDVIVDPGSYVYTSQPVWRNRFRSTAYHNTVVVDGEEQNRFNENILFVMNEDARARCLKWESRKEYDWFIGEHYGYTRLPVPITHRREIKFYKDRATWEIGDILDIGHTGSDKDAEHRLEWYFHLSPAIAVEEKGNNVFLLGDEVELTAPGHLKGAVTDGFYSPSYGIKTENKVIKFEHSGIAPFEVRFQLKAL